MEDLIREFFEKLGVTPESVEVGPHGDDCEEARVTLADADARLFFAFDGEKLYAAEHLLRMIRPDAELAERQLFRLDINGFRASSEDAVREKVREIARKVKADGIPRDLPSMTPAERRVAHMIVRDEFPGLVSESEGEERSGRRVVVREG